MMHPRRLKGTSANLARYYGVGDYYTKGTDEHSEWGGKNAAELGLEGRVEPAILQSLLEGRVGDQRLGRQRDGRLQHHPGWDFAVSAPKSVSIMALVGGDERIAGLHEHAVGTALAYLEEHAAFRRSDRGSIVCETSGRLIYARFTEHASRELDPHLHTHVVVMNMTNREDGVPMASLETRAMFAEQMATGQVYRNELAHGLRELGYEVDFDPRNGLFEICGVPSELIRSMSQRASQIDEHAREHGLTGQAARRKSFYETRGPKEKGSLESLREQWASRAEPHRAALEQVSLIAARTGERLVSAGPALSARAMLFGLKQSESREAVNNLGALFRSALASHVGEVRLADIRPLAEEHEARAKLLATRHATGDAVHTRGRTSRQMARLELALSDHLALAIGDAKPIASQARLDNLSKVEELNAAQSAALLHIGSTTDRIVGVHGVAGAGKSTLVKALRDAAEPGTTLLALAPTSSAAANLGSMAGIESRTVASLIAGGGWDLDHNHVLVLDEAGQLGSRQALRILEISRATGARLILLGDNRQTGAIEQGKPFWLMQRLGLSKAELPESVRQETRTMKAAVTQARLNNFAASLGNLDKVISGERADRLAGQLVAEWTRLSSDSRKKTNILVLENSTRLLVNTKVRDALKAEGAIDPGEIRLAVLTPSGITDQEKHFARFYSAGQIVVFARDEARLGIVQGTEYRASCRVRDKRDRQLVLLIDQEGRSIHWNPALSRASRINVFNAEVRDLAPGDRIQWRLVNHELGIRNADRGSVEKLAGKVATIRWDRDGRIQAIDLGQHKNWDHGYSETIYSAQSKTYDRVYVLAPVNSPLVTAQNYYTAITRARFGVKLWTEDEKTLVARLERRSGEKSSALEGLGRLDRDSVSLRMRRTPGRYHELRRQQETQRASRTQGVGSSQPGLGASLADNARDMVDLLSRWVGSMLQRDSASGARSASPAQARETVTQSSDRSRDR